MNMTETTETTETRPAPLVMNEVQQDTLLATVALMEVASRRYQARLDALCASMAVAAERQRAIMATVAASAASAAPQHVTLPPYLTDHLNLYGDHDA